MEHGLLSELTDADRRTVLTRMARRSFRKDDTLFHEGDPGDSLHIIEKGRVAIRVSTPGGDAAILTVLRPGDSFGEQALLDASSTRTASAVALEVVETRTLHRNDFEALRRQQPSVERLLVEVLAAQVRRLSAQLLDALYMPVDARVVLRLSELAEVYDNGAPVVRIPLKQEDLASIAGTTRPTANRVLQQLASDGIVELGRGRVHVLDRAALARRAGH
ncbi:MAG: Crp/Fnr family transcriptional regulator [Ilumatobacteraceae bacterium]